MNRRDFLASTAALATAAAAPGAAPKPSLPKGKAEHCVFVWLGGGMAQVDTFDPKARGNNKGTPKKAGSLYESIPAAVSGVRVCEHLAKTAKLMDRVTAVRTVNHKVIDEHAFATNLVHTGRTTGGTVTYPSVGSVVAHERGAASPEVPAYILVGYPNVSRGPGFLGAKHGYVYLTDTTAGPAGFTRPPRVGENRAADRRKLLAAVAPPARTGSAVAEYEDAQAEALRLAGPAFRKHFDLTPKGLIQHLKLRRPIYRKTAAYGHFGRSEPGFTWERTDKAAALARAVR